MGSNVSIRTNIVTALSIWIIGICGGRLIKNNFITVLKTVLIKIY